MKKEAHYYGLNMLPLYVEMSEGQLGASKTQLEYLKKVESKPHVLDDLTVSRIIKVHKSQNDDNWVFFEQCKKWRNDSSDEEQLRLIARIEKSASELESVNLKILALMEAMKGMTIDSMQKKDDPESVLDWLLKGFHK